MLSTVCWRLGLCGVVGSIDLGDVGGGPITIHVVVVVVTSRPDDRGTLNQFKLFTPFHPPMLLIQSSDDIHSAPPNTSDALITAIRDNIHASAS